MNPPYRRAVLGIALAMVMLGAVPAAVFAAQPSCGDTLTTNTTLTANLNCSGYSGTALYMGADEIVLNLNGKTITGPTGADGYDAIDTDGFHRTVIRNGKINDYSNAVYVNESNRTLVQNIQVTGEGLDNTYGVYVYGGVKNNLNLLNVSGVETAVYHEYGSRLRVTNSTLASSTLNGEGIYLYETAYDTVSNNMLTGDYGAYEYQSKGSTYSGNTANGGNYGFYFECGARGQVHVTGNTANNNSYAGFYVDQCYTLDHPIDGYVGSRIVGNTANNIRRALHGRRRRCDRAGRRHPARDCPRAVRGEHRQPPAPQEGRAAHARCPREGAQEVRHGWRAQALPVQ